MPNLKVSIIEKVKLASGKWTNLPGKIPKSKPNGKGLYLKDCRDGNFYLLWREGGQRRYLICRCHCHPARQVIFRQRSRE